ncbi:hypothetical protein ACYUJ6_10700 [Clostridium sp. JNZ X4-2]
MGIRCHRSACKRHYYYADDGVIKDRDIQQWTAGSKTIGAFPKNAKVKVSDIVTHQFDKYGNSGSQPNYIVKE